MLELASRALTEKAWMYASDNDEAAVLRLLRSFGADETEEAPKEEEQP
jgi:hypothetical protein